MPKPRRALTPTPWFNLAFFNALDPILKIVLGVITLIGALYGFVSVIVDLVGWLQQPRLDLYMSDVVWPIVEPNGDECAINVQFVVYNPTRRMVALRRLEAKLTRPNWTAMYRQEDFPLEWNCLIRGGPNGFENAAPIVVKPVPAHQLEVLGVQLRSYDRKDSPRIIFDWVPGEYVLRLYGFVNLNDTPTELSPPSGFRFKLTTYLSGRGLTESFSPPARLVNLSQRK